VNVIVILEGVVAPWYAGSRFLRRASTNTEGVSDRRTAEGKAPTWWPPAQCTGPMAKRRRQEQDYLDAISAGRAGDRDCGSLDELNLRVT